MTSPCVSDIRECLEGAIPAVLATSDGQGVPNVAYLSQVFFVDDGHVALSFQFFNKTRRNILANPRAVVLLIHPVTVTFYRLHLRYLRTEQQGPLFERMKAQLAGIASHSGMDGVFQLLGADIYQVDQVEQVPGEPLPAPPAASGRLAALRAGAERIARSTTLDEAFDAFLATLGDRLGMRHAMVLVLDAKPQRLYTVASRGYSTSGVGSEIMVGHGVIGVAARERVPIRISHVTNAALYSQALRSSAQRASSTAPADEIPYPGLERPHSQMAVPILSMGRLLGVAFVESPRELQFGHEDEDALVALAGHLGAAMELLQVAGELESAPATVPTKAPQIAGAMVLRRFKANDSIFVDDHYLIKGVAGAILWKLARDHLQQGRTDFSNRELRLDPGLGLPDVTDNLEARLLLLQRRLQEHGPHLRIEKTGRGRFRLVVGRKLQLAEA